LTKHIHIKSSSHHDDVDSDEYANYFPSFMWVVRDFTLQLLSEDDEEMTPNQYLEKALEEQKGFSDKTEEKNRIRRLLKSFFKERQCFTMIRPVTDEDSLQNLEQMSEDMFRAEFLEQVTQLRRKVTHCIKPKVLNGKQLTPEMFVTLSISYVEAINHGAVPNIENAWTYICQNESKKSMEKAVCHFDEYYNENIIHRGPVEERTLRDMYREVKDECKDIFTKASIGGIIEEHLRELEGFLDTKFDKILDENERECSSQ
jgi:hypothetical protein